MVSWTRFKCTKVSLDMPHNNLVSCGQKTFWHKYIYILDKRDNIDYITCSEYLSLDEVRWYHMETKVSWLEEHNGNRLDPTI